MSTHSICFHGEVKRTYIFQLKKMCMSEDMVFNDSVKGIMKVDHFLSLYLGLVVQN